MSVAISPKLAEPNVDEQVRRFHFTVDRYVQMIEAGVFDTGARLELIEGEILEMSPIGFSHQKSVLNMGRILNRLLKDKDQLLYSAQVVVQVGDNSAPQSDFAILRFHEDMYGKAYPGPQDVPLIVEVADSSLGYDQGEKCRLYAMGAYVEYWLVNIPELCVEIYRDPRGGVYTSRKIHKSGEGFSPLFAPEFQIDPSQLF